MIGQWINGNTIYKILIDWVGKLQNGGFNQTCQQSVIWQSSAQRLPSNSGIQHLSTGSDTPASTPPPLSYFTLSKWACSHANHKLFTASDFYFFLLFQLIMVWTLYGGLHLKWMSLTLLWHIFGLLSMMKTCLVNLTSLAMQYFQCAVWRLVSRSAGNVLCFLHYS